MAETETWDDTAKSQDWQHPPEAGGGKEASCGVQGTQPLIFLYLGLGASGAPRQYISVI